MDRADGVVIASTGAPSAEEAAREIAAQIASQLRPGDTPREALAGLVCFVCASYDAAALRHAKSTGALPGVAIYGCTTAGELAP